MSTEQTQQTSQSQSNGGSQSTDSGASQANGGSQATQQNQPTRPDAFADSSFDRFWDAKDGVKYTDLAGELKNLTAFKAADDLKRASLPGKPDDYKLELPNGFKLPDGVQWAFDEKDARIPEIRKLAHEAGLDQQSFARLLGVHVAHQLGEDQRIATARKAEIDKLGVNGPARVDAATTFLKSMIGDAGAQLMDRLVLASDLEAMENLIKKVSSNVVPFSQQHREQSGGTFNEDEYAKLPVGSARVEYMRKHGQKTKTA